jgi:hypothetical protein
MVKQDAEDVKKEVEKQKKEFYGNESIGSGSPSPETDDDAGKAMKEVTGHEPDRDTTIEDEVEAAEDRRRGKEPHEEESKEEKTPQLQ